MKVACFNNAAARVFLTRADLYARLDAQLFLKTRFFGAASLTNLVLAYLTGLSSSLSSQTAQWLADCGAALQISNLAWAEAISRGSLVGPGLDAHVISMEQGLVERFIAQTNRGSGANERLFFDLDGVLNRRAGMAVLHFRREVRWYSRVVCATRLPFGELDFANQQHREAIGIGLVQTLYGQSPTAAPRRRIRI